MTRSASYGIYTYSSDEERDEECDEIYEIQLETEKVGGYSEMGLLAGIILVTAASILLFTRLASGWD